MKIGFLGDTAFYGRNTLNTYQYESVFDEIKPFLDECDYIVANLEAPFTCENKIVGGKSAYLKSNPKNVELLNYLKISHVTLANNHIFDYGSKGLNDTIKTLENNHIIWYGVNGRTAEIKDERNSIRLMGFCCYSTNGKGLGEKEPFVNILNPTEIEKLILNTEEMDMLPIASFHWGQEHVHYPNYDHVELARKLCSNHKMVIHGHHPHVIQGIEKTNNSLITYSLGNFCFDDVYTKKSKEPLLKLSKDNKESILLVLNLDNNEIINYYVIPFTFFDGVYIIDNTIKDKLDEWSSFLKTEKSIYIEKRDSDLMSYISSRKKQRNLQWYLKRLNLESYKMIKSSKENSNRYNKLIKSYISE